MGYRSDVGIVIYGEESKVAAFIAAQRILNANWLRDEYTVDKYKSRSHECPEDTYETWSLIHAEFDSVKWYPQYDEVAAWHNAMNAAEECGLNYEFVRVGEEQDDIETSSGGDEIEYHLYTSCSINKDFPHFI